MRVRWRFWACVLAAATLASLADSLAAQEQGAERNGVWISAGLGAGSLALTDGSGRAVGYSYDVSLGYIPNSHFLLGLEYAGCDPKGAAAAQSLGLLLRYYPFSRAGLYGAVTGGIAGRDSSSNLFKGEDAVGWGAGIGYDIRLGEGAALRPQLFYRAVEEGPRTDQWQLNLGFSIYGPIIDL